MPSMFPMSLKTHNMIYIPSLVYPIQAALSWPIYTGDTWRSLIAQVALINPAAYLV